MLQLDVTPPTAPATSWTINSPLRCRAVGADGSVIDFEIEDPAAGIAGQPEFTVDVRWNRANLVPYYWDDSTRCLLAGSADLYLTGWNLGLYAGQQLLLDSPAAESADPPVREIATVASVIETSDPVLAADLTHVYLSAPTTHDHDLFTVAVAGNIVPAVQGQRHTDGFVIPDPSQPPPGPVVGNAGKGAAGLSVLPGLRSAGLARHADAGQGHHSPGPARDRAERGPVGRWPGAAVGVQALAAGLRAGRASVHADA